MASALLFIYSLGFATDLYDAFKQPMMSDPDIYDDKYVSEVKGAEILWKVQPFNKQLTTVSIILIVCSVIMFITNNHSRRKYYVGNFVTIGISSVVSVAAAIWNVINVAKFKNLYQTTVDFEQLKIYSELMDSLYIGPDQTFWFDIGFVISAVLIVVTAINIYNLTWKIRLMKEEAQLIKEGMEDENV